MKTLLAVLLGSLAAAPAFAAPKAESAMECGIAADMAVVARSLAEEQVQPPQASAIMARIYDVSESDARPRADARHPRRRVPQGQP